MLIFYMNIGDPFSNFMLNLIDITDSVQNTARDGIVKDS